MLIQFFFTLCLSSTYLADIVFQMCARNSEEKEEYMDIDVPIEKNPPQVLLNNKQNEQRGAKPKVSFTFKCTKCTIAFTHEKDMKKTYDNRS